MVCLNRNTRDVFCYCRIGSRVEFLRLARSRSSGAAALGGEVRTGLTGGGNRIRTISPAEKETAVERGPAADHRRLARRSVLNDPIQLIGPASLVGNSRETFHKSGTDGSNPVPSAGESANFWFLGDRLACGAPN